MPDISSAPATLKCNICGGEIRKDFLSATAVCAHCGNKWSLSDILPEYLKYSSAIEKIKKAQELLNSKPDVTNVAQAKILFQNASVECLHTDATSSELLAICREGQKNCEDLRHYAVAMGFYDRKSYRQALEEFQKIPGIKDSEAKIEECKVLAEKEKKKLIPIAVIVALIIPTALGVLLKEKVGIPLYVIIPACLVLVAGLTYAVWKGGTLATVIIAVSIICAVPLLLFMVLAYGLHMETGAAASIAIGAPIAFIVAVGLKTSAERPK
ncbi:MAG: hypothetical protein J6Y58_05340 [Clostridiales bacterium]|nr:hypothetical protein [Clostridiales bacterium]